MLRCFCFEDDNETEEETSAGDEQGEKNYIIHLRLQVKLCLWTSGSVFVSHQVSRRLISSQVTFTLFLLPLLFCFLSDFLSSCHKKKSRTSQSRNHQRRPKTDQVSTHLNTAAVAKTDYVINIKSITSPLCLQLLPTVWLCHDQRRRRKSWWLQLSVCL